MISSSKNRVQEIKSKFENLTTDHIPKRLESQLYKQKHEFTVKLGKENAENPNDYDISSNKDNIGNESESSDDWSPRPNNSYLYSKSEVKRSASDTKNTLTRQSSDPCKKLHRSHAFRCDKSQKITHNSPKRHGSCNGRSETSDFALKMERKLNKERLRMLGNVLEEHMRKENFPRKENLVPDVEYAEIVVPSDERAPDSIPNSAVPPHILEQYAQIVKPKKKDIEKQDTMTDSGVSSETENVEEEKAGRFKRLRSQFEKSPEKTNLQAMDEFCDSSETIRLERKNPHLILTDTLKKALKQPLPPGPPPKKPPRLTKPTISEEDIEQQKKEALRKLEKLENYYQQKREATTEKPEKKEVLKKPKEIHYLCTEILDITNRTLLPNQTSDPISRCLNSLNCAITNNSTSSLPYTRLKPENQTLALCCASNDSLDHSGQRKCLKCSLNEEKDGFKCHLSCKCSVKNSEFYVENEHIYDVPCSDDDVNVRRNTYGTLNSLKTSKSLEDLRVKSEDQIIYDIPYDVRPPTPEIPLTTQDPPKVDFTKLRQNFENGFPETEVKKPILLKPKPILVSKLKTGEKFNTEVKRNRNKNEGVISFTLPKRDTQLDIDRENLNSLMNELFETVTAVCNMDENKPGSFPTEHSDSSTSEESVKLTRSLTEKRKNYVRRVSTRVAYLDPKNIKRFRNQTSICSYKSEIIDNPYSTFRSWKSFRTSQGNITKMDTDSKFNLTDSKGNLLTIKDMLDSSDSMDNLSIDEKAGCVDLPFEPREKGLFNLCLLVGLNYMTGQAYVKSTFPSQVQVPPHIENLVFPETMSAAPKSEWSVDARSLQCYSLVLTDERGERAYGYCRRVLPEGATTCLPLCYCLIGRYRAPGFYYKVLEEIEAHHGRSDVEIHSLLQQLYDNDFPNPGEEITVVYTNTQDYCKHVDADNNNVKGVSLCVDLPRLKTLKRPIEPRVDEDNMSSVLDVLGAGLLIKVFASLLLERKLIIIGNHMRLVSSCIEALQSSLYPFVWQQPLISSIPHEIQREVLEAPLPILAGMLHAGNSGDFSDVMFDEGMLLDLSHPSKVLIYQGDESTILPTSCYKSLKTSLQMETSKHRDVQDIKTRNVMISEAFLRFFVEILGDFWLFFSVGELKDGDLGKGDVVFDKENFIKSASSKQNQYFLEWFTETAMFTHFIQNMAATYHHRHDDVTSAPDLVDTPLPNFYELFNERVKIRSNKSINKSLDNSKSNYKNAVNKKVKFLKSKLRDLVA
ncbi:uncharacterized protein LOC142984783 [Anticarsia gemmatalis]|uniref:uncharacterized protein LOC142984783 n=1 Tax=Anticarsia gemmatalis TaxID=129554 RepID=UPI003F764C01